MNLINGFSRLNRKEKIDLIDKKVSLSREQVDMLYAFNNIRGEQREITEKLSENCLSGFTLPFGVVPNIRVNNRDYFVPVVTEESSVVAAASYAAKFWYNNGGFRTRVTGTLKTGQVFFTWTGDIELLKKDFPLLEQRLREEVSPVVRNMEKRGGGIRYIALKTDFPGNRYYSLDAGFETADSMGANFINTCLEAMASGLKKYIASHYALPEPDIIMSILSNYTPGCMVECEVECETERLSQVSQGMEPEDFARKFGLAVQIAEDNIARAVTHNKGILNGVDAVLLATGNDTRAAGASVHAYASEGGRYKPLTEAVIDSNRFRYRLKLPLAAGTVGGAASVHPMAKTAFDILNRPSAVEFMQIVAATGMASNFAAVTSLITQGIQKGHMKLHLDNIMISFGLSENDREHVYEFFRDKTISYYAVKAFLEREGIIKNG